MNSSLVIYGSANYPKVVQSNHIYRDFIPNENRPGLGEVESDEDNVSLVDLRDEKIEIYLFDTLSIDSEHFENHKKTHFITDSLKVIDPDMRNRISKESNIHYGTDDWRVEKEMNPTSLDLEISIEERENRTVNAWTQLRNCKTGLRSCVSSIVNDKKISFLLTTGKFFVVGVVSKTVGKPIGYSVNRFLGLAENDPTGKFVGRFIGGAISQLLLNITAEKKADFSAIFTRSLVAASSGSVGDRMGSQIINKLADKIKSE